MKHIYFNGKVYTGSLPLAEAFAVEMVNLSLPVPANPF